MPLMLRARMVLMDGWDKALAAKLVEAERVGARILSAWGMTENGAVTVVTPSDPDDRSVSSDGFALPGMELEVRAPDGTPFAAGEEGELYARGCLNFVGYLKRPQWNP
jgi:cyclohexanecarboxylate-CoA ligase